MDSFDLLYVFSVFSQMCPNCHGVVHYDGSSDSMLNMGSFAVSHNLLRNFMHHFVHGRWVLYECFFKGFMLYCPRGRTYLGVWGDATSTFGKLVSKFDRLSVNVMNGRCMRILTLYIVRENY